MKSIPSFQVKKPLINTCSNKMNIILEYLIKRGFKIFHWYCLLDVLGLNITHYVMSS